MVNPCTKVPATSQFCVAYYKKKASEHSFSEVFAMIPASQLVECNRPVPKARSRRNRRQKCRECSYYHLHCNLNNTLFHFLIKSFLILYSCLSLCSRLRRIASHWGLALT